jgi:hypothetical protein
MASKMDPGVIPKTIGYGIMSRRLPNETGD